MSAPDRIIYAWREEQGDVWTGEWALDRADKWVPAEAKEYILVTAHEAAVAAARAEGMRAGIKVAASLAAAISLLERGGKAAKKAAPSDAMFDQMLTDYRKSLTEWRAEYAEASK